MTLGIKNEMDEKMKKIYPGKFASTAEIFSHIQYYCQGLGAQHPLADGFFGHLRDRQTN